MTFFSIAIQLPGSYVVQPLQATALVLTTFYADCCHSNGSFHLFYPSLYSFSPNVVFFCFQDIDIFEECKLVILYSVAQFGFGEEYNVSNAVFLVDHTRRHMCHCW